MDLPRNRFKAALAEGRPQLGLWVSRIDGLAAEVVAGAGFDWLLLDTEHSPGHEASVLAQLQALAPYPLTPVVRPVTNDTALIKRFLDLGVQTLLIPYVQSAAEAEAAVAAMRYPTRGVRGISTLTRATGFGRVADYLGGAEAELCLLVQIETRAGLDAIEAIAAVDGVHGLFIGPSDLSASLGHLGDPGHPEVVAAVEDAIARIRAAGKPAGFLSLDPAFNRRCIALGTTFTAVGTDLALLARGADALRAEYRA